MATNAIPAQRGHHPVAAVVRRRLAEPLAATADTHTRAHRSRAAEAIFIGRRPRLVDQVATSAYFSLFSWVWAGLAANAAHLDPFVAALDALDPACDPRLVIDVGTGAGRSAVLLAERFPGARVEGLDASRRMLHEAAERPRPANLGFRRADVRRLPYAAATVDLVACLNAIVSPPEVRRILAGDGLLVTASTWFPPRDEESLWMRRFGECGFDLADRGGAGCASWEVWTVRR